MKVRVSLIGLVAVALALALLGVFNSARSTNAILPQPIQPFGPDDKGGISTTALGQGVLNYTVTEIIRGERVGLPWIYSGGGWGMNLDANVDDGTPVGSVISSIDALCASTSDADVGKLATTVSATTPYTWFERTTAVASTPEEYLLKIVPPFPWLLRHRADINNVWLFGTIPYATNQVLNTVYTSVPFSPSGTFTATTKLGGSPAYPSPASGLCLDSPQSSTSITGSVPPAASGGAEAGADCANAVDDDTDTIVNDGCPAAYVYSTPPLEGDGGDADTLDDNSGFYPRWTAFQNANAIGQADSRKPFKSPPSIASDTGYVERIIDLQCYWLDDNGCDIAGGTCDLDAANGISSDESLADDDIPAGIDDDGDCLADAALAQPGEPSESTADDTPSGTDCAVLPYSEAPNLVQNDNKADRDCDGLVDGVEVAWGSDPTLADTDSDGATDFVEMFQFTDPTNPDTDGDGVKDKPEDDYVDAAIPALQCSNNWDDDGDGKVNDGCPAVVPAETTGAQCDDNVDSDADTVVNDGCPVWPTTGGTAEGAVTSGENGEAANADDNCPTIANADQANNDGQRRDNGSVVPGSFASNPTGDKMGDACDPDDDNDMAVDVAELAREDPPLTPDPTNPLKVDTDGDGCIDGVEGYVGTDPTLSTSKCPAALAAGQLKFFRACRWNEPPNGYGSGTLWDVEYDGLEDNIEWDPDGDGLACQTGTSVTDDDNDNGSGAASPPVQIVDTVEITGYGALAANKDTDGDGCEDWIEIVDINGNRSAELLDVLFIAKRALGVDPSPGSDALLDVDKNGSVTILDALVAAKNSSLVKSHSPCTSEG